MRKLAQSSANFPEIERLRVTIRGAVQGVGFRPHVFKLATSLSLTGWILNSPQGVTIEVEGPKQQTDGFLTRVATEAPPQSFIQSIESAYLDPVGFDNFEIRDSEDTGTKTAIILPDIATCPDCLREVLDTDNRRYHYPFTNCTNCGPRFTIIEALPYDRPNTTMKSFEMCDVCRSEYEDPTDRRFHAQPNACPECGPHIELWDTAGAVIATHADALLEATSVIRRGGIAAIKGLGGFHLVVDARDGDAVRRLRERKHREQKPLALMYPSLQSIVAHCHVSPQEAQLLTSAACPIVLLHHRLSAEFEIDDPVAPGNPYRGAMLPYTPLHHLLMAELGEPIVATSGNVSDEPICIDEREALERLGGIADVLLVHNRPIARHVDDSIVRIVAERNQVLRRARGYAPLPVCMRKSGPPLLAVGAHLKNTVALAVEDQVFVSQHIGDLETTAAYGAFENVITSLQNLYNVQPSKVVCDAHPDYVSTRYAHRVGVPIDRVQHHVAHVLSCMAENELEPPVLGVSWDGTGYGDDGTVWGGEFFRVTEEGVQRIAHLRTFPLPGGERAIREPRRVALALLYEMHGDVHQAGDLATYESFSEEELGVFEQMLRTGANSPRTSSAGRLFDAVASLVGLRQVNHFEGQAAMELEFHIETGRNVGMGGSSLDGTYEVVLSDAAGVTIVDWEPMIRAIIEDVRRGDAAPSIAARLHNTLAEAIVSVAKRIAEPNVVLTGGCFQNKYLTEQTIMSLRRAGFRPYWHQRVPPNDGGIALGQIAAAGADFIHEM